jgi:transcription elongation factor GreA
MTENHIDSMGEVATNYLSSLAAEAKEAARPEVFNFVRWFGRDRPLAELSPSEVANYAERMSVSDSDYLKKLVLVRAFLTWVKNKGLSKTNLAIHLKPRKGKSKTAAKGTQGQPETVPVTSEGYDKLKAELEELKQRRPQVIAEITKAAADKDFRENAPLEAAREQHGLIEGRIREIEAILKAAEIVDKERNATLKVCVGDNIILLEIATGEEMHYKIVGPRETDPARGKISGVSPVGKAVVGKTEGAVIEVAAPIGKICYQIKQIKR